MQPERRKRPTNRPTTNPTTPKTTKTLGTQSSHPYGSRTTEAPEPRVPDGKSRKKTMKLWTSITATAGGKAKRIYKNPPLYHKMMHKIDVKG